MSSRLGSSFLVRVALLLAGPAWLTAQSARPCRSGFDLAVGADGGCWREWRGDVPVTMASNYQAVFDHDGVEFTPALGRHAPHAYPLRFTLDSIRRGLDLVVGPPGARPAALATVVGGRVEYARGGGVVERYDAREAGIELSFLFPRRPPGAGDLVVRGRLDTELAFGGRGSPGVRFEAVHADACVGAVTIGGVTGIDASGQRVPGRMRCDGRWLEFVLDGDYLDHAVYPVVLDPLIGTDFPVDVLARDSRYPDVAYDAGANVYCVVWTWASSTTDIRVVARQIDADTGAWMSPSTISTSGSICEKPVVANVSQTGCFVVAWQRWVGRNYQLEARQFFARASSPSSTTLVVSADGQDPDIAGDPSGTDDEAVVVWRQNGGVYAADLRTNSTIRTWTTVELVRGVNALTPTISKTFDTSRGGGYPGYLIVWLEGATLSRAYISRDMGVLIPAATIGTWSLHSRFPSIDGDGQRFLLASEKSIGSNTWIDTIDVRADFAAGRTYQYNYAVTRYLGIAPSVAYAGDRYVVGFRQPRGSAPNWDVGLITRTFPEGTEDPCGFLDTVQMPAGYDVLRLAVVAHRSGTWRDDDRAFVLFERSDGSTSNLRGQRFELMGPGGPTVDLGGGCGLGGTLSPDGPFAIGNQTFRMQLAGADPVATAAVLSLGFPASAITCGPCRILPPVALHALSIRNGAATLDFPVGCSRGLVGGLIEAQCLLLSPSSRDCPILAGVAASNRLGLTVGR